MYLLYYWLLKTMLSINKKKKKNCNTLNYVNYMSTNLFKCTINVRLDINI